MRLSTLCFLTSAACLLNTILCDKVVMTKTGPVQGITVRSEGVLVEAYLGIPFAEPPVGRLRFSKPVPKTPWSGVYDASRLPPTCVQNVTRDAYYTPDVTNMTEDCLYLNVWVPHRTQRTRLKPVLFFVHGGAFNVGSSNMKIYDGAKMAAMGDIVVVTTNYRVGVMGFFSAFIEEADGNMGLFDQVLSLTWVSENAASFGGDPAHIVMWGQSAGAMSVAGHILSPLSRHMIKRVIMESGGGMLPMILDENARLYKTSQRLATMVGCADKSVSLETDPRIIVDCLKRLPAGELSRAEGSMMGSNPLTFIPRTGDAFIPQNTIELIRNGNFTDMEMLVGVNKNEGNFFLTASLPQYFGFYGLDAVQTISKRLAFQMTRVMYKVLEDPDAKEVAEYYVNGVENGSSDAYTNAISESIGDYLITCNTVFHSEFHSIRRNPVYFYLFKHRSPTSPLADWMGVTHFDEVQYVFGNPLNAKKFTAEEDYTSRRMMARWVAFAKTGNPNIYGEVDWPMFSFDDPAYLEINVQESVKTRPDNYRCEFWRDRYRAGIDNQVVERLRQRSSAARTSEMLVYLVVPVLLFIVL